MIKILDDLAEKWEGIANLVLTPIKARSRDETMALSGIESGAQATRAVCALELRAAIPVVEAEQRELVGTLRQAKDAMTNNVRRELAYEAALNAIDAILARVKGA